MKYNFSRVIIDTTLHLIFVLYLIKGGGEKEPRSHDGSH
jgi:hypothetical protein